MTITNRHPHTQSKPLIELCVDDVDGVRIARDTGVDRVELCASLEVGGLTPPLPVVIEAQEVAPAGGLQVIVRSRAGDFCYTTAEIQEMCQELRKIRQATQDAPILVGFVVGALNSEGSVDEGAAAAFREAAEGRPLTFHRAFDSVPSAQEALEILVDLGYDRILTTGGHPSVAQTQALAALNAQAQGRISIIASGGVRSGNISQILAESQAPEVHMRAPKPLGGTDPEEVERIMRALGR